MEQSLSPELIAFFSALRAPCFNPRTLIEQGSFPSHFFFLVSGTAKVSIAGQGCVHVSHPSLFGEVGYFLSSIPATATVEVDSDSDVFQVPYAVVSSALVKLPSHQAVRLIEEIAALTLGRWLKG